MSIFSSASKAISSIFDTVTDVGGTLQETVQIGTTFVHNRAQRQIKLDKLTVIVDTAKDLEELQKELDADVGLAAKVEELQAEWD